jgi:hypothetical protein
VQARFKVLKDWSASLVARLPEGQVFDERVIFVLIFNQLLYYNTLLGDEAVTDDEYLQFLRDKMTKI